MVSGNHASDAGCVAVVVLVGRRREHTNVAAVLTANGTLEAPAEQRLVLRYASLLDDEAPQ